MYVSPFVCGIVVGAVGMLAIIIVAAIACSKKK